MFPVHKSDKSNSICSPAPDSAASGSTLTQCVTVMELNEPLGMFAP